MKALRLPVADEDEKAVAREGVQRAGVLLLPIQRAGAAELEAVARPLRVRGLDEAAEKRRAGAVVVLHFLVDAGADEFAHGQPARRGWMRFLSPRVSVGNPKP